MGLAASQARFLGITLRKANCEFKSTELAQQRLELTNQMTDISQEYANALNATKLVWHNEAVCDSFGNPMDYGLSYSLMMIPSAANDYNPYMFTSRTGAIILNSKYAQAAKDAGISMAGGVASAEGRNKFIASLANVEFDENGNIKTDSTTGKPVYKGGTDNVITPTTFEILSGLVDPMSSGADVDWHSSAGMGAVPKEKGVADGTTLKDLLMDEDFGQMKLDWLQIYRAVKGLAFSSSVTQTQYDHERQLCIDNISLAKLNYINKGGATSADADAVYNYANDSTQQNNQNHPYKLFADLESAITNAQDAVDRNKYISQLENLKHGKDEFGNFIDSDDSNQYKYPIYWAAYELKKLEDTMQSSCIGWAADSSGINDTHIDIGTLFQTTSNSISDATYGEENMHTLTLVVNDVIKKDAESIKSMTITDLMKNEVVLMTQGDSDAKSVSIAAQAMLEYVASLLGYGSIGKGLNVDETANMAMEMAMKMAIKKVLNPANAVANGGACSDSNMRSNDAYNNAINYNRIGQTENKEYAAISLSNVVSAFLTYFDNYLRGTDSGYVVGKGNTDGKTVFVTDDPGYIYVTSPEDGISNDERIADFYNQLYNNICDKGWRPDEMVNDSGYLESAIKDGRYQMMALNSDGYFYQMRYNDLPYMVEEQDEDAIARAEAAFTTKKAQITFKEDEIDIKTKKLDAEITELNTEINSVQNIITKSIEKTFSMFSN